MTSTKQAEPAGSRVRLAGAAIILCSFFSMTFGGGYTLEQLLEKAYETSEEIKAVEEELGKADAQIMQAYGSALPSLTASANANHAFRQFNTFNTMSGSSMPKLTDFLQPTDDPGAYQNDYLIANYLDQLPTYFSRILRDNTVSLMLTLNQPIYAQGKVGVGLKVARIYKENLNQKKNDQKLQVKSAVTKLFYSTLLAEKNNHIQSDAVKIAQETHRIALLKFAVGKAAELDTLSSRLHWENARISLKKAESDLRMAYSALIERAGLKGDADNFSITGEFPPAVFEMTLERALEIMHANNSQIMQLKSAEELQQQAVNFAKTDYRPLVFAGASMGKIAQFDSLSEARRGRTWQSDVKVFMGLSWNLFSGFQNMMKVRQAEADRAMFVLNEKLIVDNLVLAVRKSYEDVIVSKEQLAIAQDLVRLAEKGLKIAQKSYEIGMKTLLDVQNTELEANKAKIGYNAALFQFHGALVDLKARMGTL